VFSREETDNAFNHSVLARSAASDHYLASALHAPLLARSIYGPNFSARSGAEYSIPARMASSGPERRHNLKAPGAALTTDLLT